MLELVLYILGFNFLVGVLHGLLGIPTPRDIPPNFRVRHPPEAARKLLTAPPLVQLEGPVGRGEGQRVLQLRDLSHAGDESKSLP